VLADLCTIQEDPVNVVSSCELVGLLATCLACVFFLIGSRRTRLVGSTSVLTALLLINLANYSSNFVEWTGIPTRLDLDAIEDTLDLLSPLVWWFLFYSCFQAIVSLRLRESLEERKRMERSVRASEARLRSVLDNVPVHIFNLDRDGKIVFANRSFEGFPMERSLGASIHRVLPIESEQTVRVALERAFASGHTQTFEIVEPDPKDPCGALAWYSCQVEPVSDESGVSSVIFVATDIADIKQAERELRESEERFRTLVQNAPEAILVFDIDEGRIVECNQNARELFGLEPEQLLNASLLDISPPLQPDRRASAEIANELMEQALDGQAPVAPWTCCNAEGDQFRCEIRLVRLPSARRRLVRGSLILLDSREQTP
jgi:PAS domain S-box-containing protein